MMRTTEQSRTASENPRTPPFKSYLLLAFAALLGVFHAFFISFFKDIRRTAIGFLSGAVAGMLFYLLLVYILWPHAACCAFVTTFGPPLFLLIFTLANIVDVSLLGLIAAEPEREWRSRFNAWTMIIATLWIAVVGVALYGCGWWQTLMNIVLDAPRSWEGLSGIAAIATWLTTVVSGLRAAFSSKTSGNDKGWLELLVRVTPLVFLLGISLMLSWTAEWLIRPENSIVRGEPYYAYIGNPNWQWLVASFAICAIVAFVASCRVNVNEFSLNAMYANRLVRCYLGASRRKQEGDFHGTPAHCHGPVWDPNRVTGFDPHDDIDLKDLRIGGPPMPAAGRQDPAQVQNYWGPFPLINTALNLVAGDRLAWQERRAESFLLSPLFCGCDSLGYRKTDQYAAGYAAEKPLTLGRCVAISGAAVSPNMGYYSSPAVAALLTFFNVRLGWWLPNPAVLGGPNDRAWKSPGPTFLLKWLAIELASATNSKRKYLNISDGGHFENLGVYELVRRRCRLIIVSDAGANPTYECAELGMVIRKCRTDFGIDIEIDTSQLKPLSDDRTSKWHCAIGTIRYDYVNPKAPVGTLVYIKPSLTGDESADVQNYARENPAFPHQSTLNQFYSESEFESYRQLGYHCLTEVLGDVARRLRAKQVTDPRVDPTNKEFADILDWVRDKHGELAENLVYHLRTQWLSPAPESHEDFLKSVENFKQLQRDLRDKAELNPISRGLYPDLPWENNDAGEFAVRQADVHVGSFMLQIMENAYVAADLEKQCGHPLNAGWMNVFHRWSQSSTLRRYWPLLRNEYGREVRLFLRTRAGSEDGIWKAGTA